VLVEDDAAVAAAHQLRQPALRSASEPKTSPTVLDPARTWDLMLHALSFCVSQRQAVDLPQGEDRHTT
jgi:hypothetical protein